MLVVDYLSRYIHVEIVKLSSTTLGIIVANLKKLFSRFGIPELVISDNGPQFVSGEMKEFAASL